MSKSVLLIVLKLMLIFISSSAFSSNSTLLQSAIETFPHNESQMCDPSSSATQQEQIKAKGFEDLLNGSTKIRKDEIAPDIKVALLDQLEIPYESWRIGARINDEDIKEKGVDPTEGFYTDIRIKGKLSKSQFDKLKAAFGNLSKVKYSKSKTDWNLTDFLPPVIQALNAKRKKVDEDKNLPSELKTYTSKFRMDSTIYDATNCHATSYEVARSILSEKGAGEFNSFFLGDVTAQFLYDPSSNVVKIKDNDKDSVVQRNKNRKLGDMAVIRNDGRTMLHTAIWLTDDLYFEKTDTSSGSPYRIVTYSDMMKTGALGNVEKTTLEFKSFDKSEFKDPKEVLSDNAGLPRTITYANGTVLEIPGKKLSDSIIENRFGTIEDKSVYDDLFISHFTGMGSRSVGSLSRITNHKLKYNDDGTARLP